MAEKEGKPVELLVVPAVNPFDALAQAANGLKASRLVTGVSARMESDELARQLGLAWESLPEPRHPFSLEVISPDRPSTYVNLGPHPPRMWPEDVDLLHEIWLRLAASDALGSRLHHRDVVGVALRRLQKDLTNDGHDTVITDIQKNYEKADSASHRARTAKTPRGGCSVRTLRKHPSKPAKNWGLTTLSQGAAIPAKTPPAP